MLITQKVLPIRRVWNSRNKEHYTRELAGEYALHIRKINYKDNIYMIHDPLSFTTYVERVNVSHIRVESGLLNGTHRLLHQHTVKSYSYTCQPYSTKLHHLAKCTVHRTQQSGKKLSYIQGGEKKNTYSTNHTTFHIFIPLCTENRYFISF